MTTFFSFYQFLPQAKALVPAQDKIVCCEEERRILFPHMAFRLKSRGQARILDEFTKGGEWPWQ
jgi:hypothetical protein